MVDTSLFRAKAPVYMRKLMAEPFGFSVDDATAVFGNIGHECAGFTLMQEVKPTVPGSAGGYGWAQWTGPRRREFEAWCKRKGWAPASDEANYSFLIRELMTTEKGAVLAVKEAIGLRNKVEAFEQAYERAGVKHYDSRMKWAEIAHAAYFAAKPEAAPSAPPVKERPSMAGPLITAGVQLAPAIIELLSKFVDRAVTKTANDQSSPVPQQTAAPVVKAEIVAEVVKQASASPAFVNATNSEPWYQSRVITGLIVSFIGIAVAATGRTLLPEHTAMLTDIVSGVLTLGGNAWALYGRVVANKPIGS